MNGHHSGAYAWPGAPWLDEHAWMNTLATSPAPSWSSDDSAMPMAMYSDISSPMQTYPDPTPVPWMSPDANHTIATPPPAQKCGYRTGKCFNLRVLKRNGKYHKLCDEHRERANWNQKKLDHKKRLRRGSNALFSCSDSTHHAIDDCRRNSPRSPTTFALDLDDPLVFGFDEAQFFCELMASHPLPPTGEPHNPMAEDTEENDQGGTTLCQPFPRAVDCVGSIADAALPSSGEALAHDEVFHFVQALLV